MSSVEQNKEIVRRFNEEAIGQGKLELLDELLHPDYVNHSADLRGLCSRQRRQYLIDDVVNCWRQLDDDAFRGMSVLSGGAMVADEQHCRGGKSTAHRGSGSGPLNVFQVAASQVFGRRSLAGRDRWRRRSDLHIRAACGACVGYRRVAGLCTRRVH